MSRRRCENNTATRAQVLHTHLPSFSSSGIKPPNPAQFFPRYNNELHLRYLVAWQPLCVQHVFQHQARPEGPDGWPSCPVGPLAPQQRLERSGEGAWRAYRLSQDAALMCRYAAFVFIGNPMLEPSELEVLLICSRLKHRKHDVRAVMGRRGQFTGSNHAAAAARSGAETARRNERTRPGRWSHLRPPRRTCSSQLTSVSRTSGSILVQSLKPLPPPATPPHEY